MRVIVISLIVTLCVAGGCKDRPGMGAATGKDTTVKSKEGKNMGDSAVAYAGKLDTSGVLFLHRQMLRLREDSLMASLAVKNAGNSSIRQFAQNILSSYPEDRRQLVGIAYQLDVPVQNDSTAVKEDRIGVLKHLNGSNFDKAYSLEVINRLKTVDTSLHSAMTNDNNLLKDFAARLQHAAQQKKDSLELIRQQLR